MKEIKNSYKKSGVDISLANKLVKHISLISKKDVQNKELEIMVEKTKINKQKIDVDSTYENKKLEKKIRDLEKKILSLQSADRHEIDIDAIKNNYDEQKKNYKEEEKKKILMLLEKKCLVFFKFFL